MDLTTLGSGSAKTNTTKCRLVFKVHQDASNFVDVVTTASGVNRPTTEDESCQTEELFLWKDSVNLILRNKGEDDY